MKSLIVLSVMLTGLLSTQAFAASKCERVYIPETLQNLKITMNHQGLLREQDYRDLIGSVDLLLGDLKPAHEIEITIEQPGIFSGYLFEDRSIGIPSSFTKYVSGKGNHPKYSLAILSHEYGHAVFEKNMLLKSKSWGQAKQNWDDLRDLRNKTQDELRTSTGEKQTLEKKLADIQLKMDQNDRFQSIQIAYHEIFADIVGVVRFQDPRIMYQVQVGDKLSDYLSDHSSKFYRTNYQDRLFDRPWGESNMKQWEQDTQSSWVQNDGSASYLIFAPARSAFWSLNQGRIKNPKTRAVLISQTLDILQKHFEDRFSNVTSADQINPRELNDSLIREFEKHWNNNLND